MIKTRYAERAFDHFHLLLAYYIFFREILQIESIVLLYFEDNEGNWKNVCQKAMTTNSSSSRNRSNVEMFLYHFIKMNEVYK